MTTPAATNPLQEARNALAAAAATINDIQQTGQQQLDLHTVICYAQAQATLAVADALTAAVHGGAGQPPRLLVPR